MAGPEQLQGTAGRFNFKDGTFFFGGLLDDNVAVPIQQFQQVFL